MRPSEPARVACFDLGGVLVRIHDGWRTACRSLGIPFDPVLEHDDFRAETRRALLDQQLGALSAREAAEALSGASRGRYTTEQFEALHASWLQGLYLGVDALLAELGSVDGLVTACLSNTDHVHWAQLSATHRDARYGVLGTLRHRFASCELGLAKPERSIYEAVTGKLGVAPSQVLFFDDTPANVDAARAYGWRAERIDPKQETVPQLREHLRAHGVPVAR